MSKSARIAQRAFHYPRTLGERPEAGTSREEVGNRAATLAVSNYLERRQLWAWISGACEAIEREARAMAYDDASHLARRLDELEAATEEHPEYRAWYNARAETRRGEAVGPPVPGDSGNTLQGAMWTGVTVGTATLTKSHPEYGVWLDEPVHHDIPGSRVQCAPQGERPKVGEWWRYSYAGETFSGPVERIDGDSAHVRVTDAYRYINFGVKKNMGRWQRCDAPEPAKPEHIIRVGQWWRWLGDAGDIRKPWPSPKQIVEIREAEIGLCGCFDTEPNSALAFAIWTHADGTGLRSPECWEGPFGGPA